MNEVLNIIANNGVAVGVLAYFVYRDNKYLSSLIATLTRLQSDMEALTKTIDDHIKGGD